MPTASGRLKLQPTSKQVDARKRIGDRLRSLRKLRRLSQTELGDAIGFSRHSVSTWEKGKAAPTWEQVASICAVLKCSADYLLLGEDVWFMSETSRDRIREGVDDPKIIAVHLAALLSRTSERVTRIHRNDASALTAEAYEALVKAMAGGAGDEE